ncbi:MAG: threonine synthase [Bdellovibrionales bacterium]|nr:threonine synthase [Bdellovibrionales bacterium]
MEHFLRNFVTKEKVHPTNMVFTGERVPWEVVVDLESIRSKINFDYFRSSPPLNSKYLPFMPVRNFADFVSLKEGATPLIPSKIFGKDRNSRVLYKLESHNPTGSFKDRGSAVDLSVAKEMKAKGIAVASTGNMAASCSCYAAAADIPCFVFVPEGTPSSKLSQVIAFGGRIVQVKGEYNDAAVLAQRVAEEFDFFLAGDYAYRVEGAKTAAFEVCEQLFFAAPDVVIVPIGCGTNIAAYKKGFEEFHELGFIDRVPQLIGVQAEGAAPIVHSFRTGARDFIPLETVDTIASAIKVGDPLDGLKALDAIYSTEGRAVDVSDREMVEAQYRLSREEGHFVEAACAASVAGYIKLASTGAFTGQTVVCVMTGDGLKDPTPILKNAIKPPTIYPDVVEFKQLFENSFFEGKTISFVSKNDILFERVPTLEEVKRACWQYFEARYSDSYLETIVDIITRFLSKGKSVNFSDFQDIVQDALESLNQKGPKTFAVSDFEVIVSRNKKSLAKVTVKHQEEVLSAEGEGVGPVDAVINALRKACREKIEFSLSSYKVNIRDQGTDAVVYVELGLKRGGHVSNGTGTSPDIIQASIEAFESAYNGFYRHEKSDPKLSGSNVSSRESAAGEVQDPLRV